MIVLLLCCIENSLAIAGLLGIICQKVYDTFSVGHIHWDDRPLHKLTWDPACHELFLMDMHSETDGIFVYKFTDSFSILLACVRVYWIQCNLLLLFYCLTFQETIKNQVKGNYGVWCLTPLATTFQLYRRSQFYLWMKPEHTVKPINPQVTDKL